MAEEVLIKVEGVRKKFCRSLKKSLWYGVKDMAAECVGGNKKHDQLRPDEFWAVNGVSFELRRGECLGLIGRNGAGKTTLLKMLNGLIKPDHGRIEMRGRIGALIALGAGFNPILTGRENIFVNGSVLGLTKQEIDDKLEDIIEFAELSEFIDAPVQSYSSGMQVRLGFAVATALNPDVLILDEVLAVGDAAFRAKCTNRMRKLQSQCAVIFVSHSMEQIGEVCNRGLVLKQGQVSYSGQTDEAINNYYRLNILNANERSSNLVVMIPLANVSVSFSKEVKYGGCLDCLLSCHSSLAKTGIGVRLVLFTIDGRMVAEFNTRNSNQQTSLVAGENSFKFEFGPLFLKPGVYRTDLFFYDLEANHSVLFRSHLNHEILATGSVVGHADTIYQGAIKILAEE